MFIITATSSDNCELTSNGIHDSESLWGQPRIKRLELVTLRQMCEKIDIPDLPRTFQDAIQFTREFGISFLWFNGLCIIQDSYIDLEKESEVMGDVYKNAICNIAATAASDGQSKCFFKQDLLLSQSLRVKIRSGGAGPPISLISSSGMMEPERRGCAAQSRSLGATSDIPFSSNSSFRSGSTFGNVMNW
jgi:hypothetical protein